MEGASSQQFKLGLGSVNFMLVLRKCSEAESVYFSLSLVSPEREPEQRNPWVFIPSQSVHLILMCSSQILHVPPGPVMIYGLESSNTSLDSFWLFLQYPLVKIQVFQNSWQVFSVRLWQCGTRPGHMEMFTTSWEVQLHSVAVAQAGCQAGSFIWLPHHSLQQINLVASAWTAQTPGW